MIPPHDLRAEKSVLGSLILDSSLAALVADVLEAEDFYSDAYGAVWGAAMSIHSQGHPIDSVTIQANLARANVLERIGGSEFITGLLDTIPTAHNIAHHAAIVRDKSLARKIQRACYEVLEKTQGDYGSAVDLIAEMDARMVAVSKSIKEERVRKLGDVVFSVMEDITKQAEQGKRLAGVSTGYRDLDKLTAGLHKGDLFILAGRPSMGKTALALNVAENAYFDAGASSLVFSMEMDADSLVRRMIASRSRMDSEKLRINMLNPSDWKSLVAASGELHDAGIWICDEPALSPVDVRSRALRLAARTQLDLVVVDYMQLMRAGKRTQSREQEVSEISRSLKALARELRVPVIALSQLNRGVEGRPDKRPLMSDLRESGAIEQDADVVAFVYRDEYYHQESPDAGVAEVIVRKQRNGATGTVRLAFVKQCTRFENLEEGR